MKPRRDTPIYSLGNYYRTAAKRGKRTKCGKTAAFQYLESQVAPERTKLSALIKKIIRLDMKIRLAECYLCEAEAEIRCLHKFKRIIPSLSLANMSVAGRKIKSLTKNYRDLPESQGRLLLKLLMENEMFGPTALLQKVARLQVLTAKLYRLGFSGVTLNTQFTALPDITKTIREIYVACFQKDGKPIAYKSRKDKSRALKATSLFLRKYWYLPSRMTANLVGGRVRTISAGKI